MIKSIEWIALTACIITEQNNKCAMCKKYLEDSEFTSHHIVPRDKGGKDELDNLIGLCDKCHDIAELGELDREEIADYYKKYSLNDYNEHLIPIRKSYFMPEIDNQIEYKYPKEIILHEKYIIKPNKTIVGFEVDKEFKDRMMKVSKNYKINGISFPINLSMFCRIAVAKLLREVERKITCKRKSYKT